MPNEAIVINSVDGITSNIPSNSFNIKEAQTEVRTVRMRTYTKGIIVLSGFAMAQFIEGADLWVNDVIKGAMFSRHAKLLIKLAKGMAMSFGKDQEFELTIEELHILRQWLEMRMTHCEKERDERTTIVVNDVEMQKFNADSYIGMKLLLLDLRETMMGEIVGHGYEK